MADCIVLYSIMPFCIVLYTVAIHISGFAWKFANIVHHDTEAGIVVSIVLNSRCEKYCHMLLNAVALSLKPGWARWGAKTGQISWIQMYEIKKSHLTATVLVPFGKVTYYSKKIASV